MTLDLDELERLVKAEAEANAHWLTFNPERTSLAFIHAALNALPALLKIAREAEADKALIAELKQAFSDGDEAVAAFQFGMGQQRERADKAEAALATATAEAEARGRNVGLEEAALQHERVAETAAGSEQRVEEKSKDYYRMLAHEHRVHAACIRALKTPTPETIANDHP